jgi:hypothetical protein
MKKIVILFAFFSSLLYVAGTLHAQVPTMNLQDMDRNSFQIDTPPSVEQLSPFVLLLKRGDLDPGIRLKFNNHSHYDGDPGILLAQKYWNCDPGILFTAQNWNYRKEIPVPSEKISTFSQFDPSNLLNPNGANFLITPFLSPFANPLLKQQELHSLKQLNIR